MREPIIKLARSFLKEADPRHMKTAVMDFENLLLNGRIFLHDLIDWKSPLDSDEINLVSSIARTFNFSRFIDIPGEEFISKTRNLSLSGQLTTEIPFDAAYFLQTPSRQSTRNLIELINLLYSSKDRSDPYDWSADFSHDLLSIPFEQTAKWMRDNGIGCDDIIAGKPMIEYISTSYGHHADYSILGLSPDLATQNKYSHLPPVSSWCFSSIPAAAMSTADQAKALLSEIYDTISSKNTITRKFLKQAFKKYPDPDVWRQAYLSSTRDGEIKRLSLSEFMASMPHWHIIQCGQGGALMANMTYLGSIDADNIYCIEHSPTGSSMAPDEICIFGKSLNDRIFSLRQDFNNKSLMNQKSGIFLDLVSKIENPGHIVSLAIKLTAEMEFYDVFSHGLPNVQAAAARFNSILFSRKNIGHFADLFKKMHQEALVFSPYATNCTEKYDANRSSLRDFISPPVGCPLNESMFGMAFTCYAGRAIDARELQWFLSNSRTPMPPPIDEIVPRLSNEPPEVLSEIVELYFRHTMFGLLKGDSIDAVIEQKLSEIKERKELESVLSGSLDMKNKSSPSKKAISI